MNKMQEVAAKMAERTKKDLMDTLNLAHDNITNFKLAQLPESIFVNHFLDFFMNFNTGDMSAPLNIKWVELSGSPYNEVEIIDGKGNVIYNVPPLMARVDVTGKPIEEFNFGKMVGEYKLRSNRIQADADNFLNRQLGGMDKQLTPNSKEDIMTRWVMIFKRYEQKSLEKKVMPETTTIKQSNADDFIDYD